MKSSDQGDILAIKLFDPGRERINWRYGSDYPLIGEVRLGMDFFQTPSIGICPISL